MFVDLDRVIEQVGRDKGIDRTVLIDAVETAFLQAARKRLGHQREIEAHYNGDTGEIEIFEFKTVVEAVDNTYTEIELDKARKQDPEAQLGDSIGIKLDASGFGRIAAQLAKQVIIQKVRDAERDIIYTEFKDRIGELINGIVRRFERGNIIVDLGRTEGLLPLREQVPGENYRIGDRIQCYFLEIEKASRGPQIILSRAHVGLLTRLFEMEVPEISEGIVKIVAAAREPGARSKIAVQSRDADVDPVGAAVGMKGSRVQAVVQELRGEKIDIVAYHDDPARFVCNAIAPADVTKVIIDEDAHTMEVVVPDDQLSLAIGRKGQNVRLAAQLTKWKIDIHSESKIQELNQHYLQDLVRIEGVDETMADILLKYQFRSAQEVADATVEELLEIPGLSKEKAEKIKASAANLGPLEEGEAAQHTSDMSPDQLKKVADDAELMEVKGIGDKTIEALNAGGYMTLRDLIHADAVQMGEKTGIGEKKASQIIRAAQKHLEARRMARSEG